ncbi:MAG TPA: glycosyltransferase family 2 protein [Ignavibacteriaceae bacterium]
MKISSLIIAKNEELNIRRCIDSQLDCIDEIIVLVDESSTDKTYDILRSYPSVKVQKIKWQGYSATKKFGVTLASNVWVLWIDADESITPELSEEIIAFKKSVPVFTAYSVPRRAYFLGKWIRHSGWYPGRVVRLFNKNVVSFNSRSVHEQLEIKDTAGRLVHDIEHYTDPSIHHYFEKFNNYTSLAASELFTRKKSFSLLDLLIRPTAIFMKMYIIKAGFLDGIHGFILAVFSASYVFTKYCKLWELERTKK